MGSDAGSHGRLAGLVVALSGGTGAIGSAMADRLVVEGARVAVLDPAADDHRDDRTVALTCDVSDPDAIAAATALIPAEWGPVGALVHCAAFQVLRPFAELSAEEWGRTMAVNVDGAFHLARAFVPGMRARGWGRVVVVTSSTYFAPIPGLTHYVTSKAALQGFVRGLATEVGADGVTVNALAPGLTRTAHTEADMPPGEFEALIARQAVKRSGRPEDQAGALAFLLSRDADFVSGQTLLVDGGSGHV